MKTLLKLTPTALIRRKRKNKKKEVVGSRFPVTKKPVTNEESLTQLNLRTEGSYGDRNTSVRTEDQKLERYRTVSSKSAQFQVHVDVKPPENRISDTDHISSSTLP